MHWKQGQAYEYFQYNECFGSVLTLRVLLQMRMQSLVRRAIHYLQHRWLIMGLRAFRIQVIDLIQMTSHTSTVSCMELPCQSTHGHGHEISWL